MYIIPNYLFTFILFTYRIYQEILSDDSFRIGSKQFLYPVGNIH